MYRTVATLLAITLVLPVQSKKLPPEFLQCRKSDPNVDKCLAEAFEKAVVAMKDGIPSHHILPSDPFSISKIVIEDTANRPVSLDLVVTDSKLHGLKDVQITKVKSDLDKREVWSEVFLKVVTLDGDYTMDGKFLILPLRGKGKVFAQIDDAKIKLHIKADPKTKNGEIHWDLKTFDLEITEIKRLTTKFGNLFNGDQTLANPTQESLNDNWKELWETLKPSIEQVFSAALSQVTTIILDEVPEKDMFL